MFRPTPSQASLSGLSHSFLGAMRVLIVSVSLVSILNYSSLICSALIGNVARADEPDSGNAGRVKHKVILCEYSGAAHRLLEVSPEGVLTWQHPFPSIAVCFRVSDNGRIVFADGGKPTGIQEVNRDHQVVFDYRSACDQILACERLSNGNYLLSEQGPCQAVEINPQGKVVSTVKLSTAEKQAHRQLRCCHRLANGHILAAHEAEAVVREYDAEGKIVWEYPGVNNVFEALPLPNGNILIGCGTDKRIVEVTRDKKIVWELTASDAPEVNLNWVTGLQLLKNGNLVVANFLRGQEGKGAHAFEVTRDAKKKIVWTFADHKMVKSITMAYVVEE